MNSRTNMPLLRSLGKDEGALAADCGLSSGKSLSMERARGIILVAVMVTLGLRVATAADPGEGGLITRLRKQEEAQKKLAESEVRIDMSDPSVAERQIESLNNSVSNAMFMAEQSKRAEEADRAVFKNTIIGLALLGIGVVLVRKFAPRIGFLFNVSDENPEARSNNPEEEKSFSEFVAAFKVGPPPRGDRAASERASDLGRGEPLKAGATASVSRSPLKIFFDDAPKSVRVLRGLIQEITRAVEQASRHKLLSDLCEKIGELKRMAGLPEVLPAWQLAVALEGLVKQLSDKDRNVTPSTLRTVASAVDLLEALSVRGIKADLMSDPPIRLLAVDDDSLSRHAVSFALKKALNKPDLAENGEAALALVAHIKYDAIFLDVQMPGMDGFEVCSKIHGTELNRTTPVVFVTCQSDFDARAKSTLSGGIDLIGKPFLTFEITVKALTLALRGRLNPRAEAASRQAIGKASETAGTRDATGSLVEATKAPSADMVANAFFAHAPVNIELLQRRLQQVHEAGSDEARQEIIVELYLAVHSLASEASLAKLQTFFQMSSAVETLLKKWIGESKAPATLPLSLVADTLDLLQDFCDAKLTANLAEEPMRILIADDDATARKNLHAAIQLPRAEAEFSDAREAIKLATEGNFDLILLNIQRASPDTLSVCSKLREGCKARTPIVCVADEVNLEILRESSQSGDFHLIQRSSAPEEISFAALTFALAGRFERLTPGADVTELNRQSQGEQLAAVAK